MTALTDLEDLYPRLVHSLLPTNSAKTTENSAGRGTPEKRRLPMRVEVHDLIARIETDVRDLASTICDALSVPRCVAHPVDSDSGTPLLDPRVLAAMATLRHYWLRFGDAMPEMAAEVDNRLVRLCASARRLLGITKAPVPLVTPCPMCGQPTIFRLDTEQGAMVACGNPEDRTVFGDRRQWDEYQWEEALDPRFASSTASG